MRDWDTNMTCLDYKEAVNLSQRRGKGVSR